MTRNNWKLQYRELESKRKRSMPRNIKKLDNCRMPRRAVEKMLASPNTPEHLKKAWRKKLKEM